MPKSTYTVKEVANLLGFSTNTVYKYLENGSIKAVRFGQEGRFRIPASEVNRLLQERDKNLQGATPASVTETQESSNIFDWFVGFLSMGLGFSQFINLVYTSTQPELAVFLPYLNVVSILIFVGGVLLLGFDVFKVEKNHRHKVLNLSIGVLYLILAVIFLLQKSVFSMGYLSLSFILIGSAFKKVNYYLQYLIFINILFVLVGLGFLIWPESSAFSAIFRTGIVTRDVFTAVWFAVFCVLLLLSFKASKGNKHFMILTSLMAGTISIMYSVTVFTSGFWGRSVFGITLGTFSFIFPFTSQFGFLKTRTKKEAAICFIWLLGVFFVGSLMLRTAYHSFQKVILDEMGRRVSLASEITKGFMDRNISTLSAFLNDNNLSELLVDGGANKSLDNELKQIYLSSGNSFVRVVITNKNGRIVDTYPFYFQAQNVDISNRDYFYEPARTGQIFVTELIKPNSPGIGPSILISLPIIDARGQFLGVILGHVDMTELQRQLGKIDPDKASLFKVTDQSGNYILNPGPQTVITKAPFDSLNMKASSGEEGSMAVYGHEGALRLEAYNNVETYNWGIVMTQGQSAIIETYSLMGFAGFLFLVITIIGSLTLVMFLRRDN